MVVALPPEILSIICELCTTSPGRCKTWERHPCTIHICCAKKTCMALRLVSREWNAASTPFVFDHIKLRLFPSSVEKFNKLCYSELAKHVKTLDFHPDLLPVWNKEAWLSNVHHRPEPPIEGRREHSLYEDAYDEGARQSLSTEELDAGWAAYEKHVLEQRRWRENVLDLRIMLRRTILRLPNLDRTTVACCASPNELRRNYFLGFSQEPFLNRLAHEIIVPARSWLVWLTPEVSNTKHVELEDACSLAYVEAISHRYTHSAAKQVKTLTLDLKSRQDFRNLLTSTAYADDFRVDYESQRQNLLQAFVPITDLTLRVREAAAHVHENDAHATDIRHILQAVKSVRTLRLEYGNFFDDEMHFGMSRSNYIAPQFALMPLLSKPEVTYQHLKELFISAVVPGQALAGFLKLHSPTLKSLQLRRSISDNWDTVLHTIAKDLDLDHLYLYWLVEGCHNYLDGELWKFRSINDSVIHFYFEQHFYWDGTPERTHRPDCVPFKKAMRRFFDEDGKLGLPFEYFKERKHI